MGMSVSPVRTTSDHRSAAAVNAACWVVVSVPLNRTVMAYVSAEATPAVSVSGALVTVVVPSETCSRTGWVPGVSNVADRTDELVQAVIVTS